MMQNLGSGCQEGEVSSNGPTRPVLLTIPSGIGLDNMAFERNDDVLNNQTTNNNAKRASLVSKISGYSSLRPFGIRTRRLTQEMTPRLANYTNMAKKPAGSSSPTDVKPSETNAEYTIEPDVTEEQPTAAKKFGWIEGVLIRNMLSIWGVMLFLRISWVVGMAGIWQTLIMISISTFITLVTALSTSAIVTNGEIGGGGTYFVMSRILGPEWGGSVGILFALANAVNGSLNVVGFCQTLQDALKNYGGYIIVDGGVNDTRILGTILMILVWVLCGQGAKYEMRIQLFLVVILFVALSNFFVGSAIGPTSEEGEARGFLGYSGELFRENWEPAYVFNNGVMQDFFTVFSVYFPAGIGILAGANVSGDLQDPSSAIPKGTIMAIIVTSISYALVAIVCAGTSAREATGSIEDLHNGTFLDCKNNNCTYGSYNDYQLMTLISAYGPLNYAGCFAATLSSALASYISCPKLLQVIGDDKLYPYWLVGWMTKPYGKSQEPHIAYFFTFLFCMVFILIAQLDVIALLISDLFLITFTFLNYACFHVDFVQSVGWRPTFKYYNKWLSLFVACLCVFFMFLLDWKIAVVTIVIVFVFYLVVFYRKPDVNWGSSSQARTFQEALTSIHDLIGVEEHVKNYHPQILAMTGHPSHRPALVDFGHLITKRTSMLVCGNVISEKQTSDARLETFKMSYNYLRSNRVKGFCSVIDGMDLPSGTSALLKTVGVGKLVPNILLLGYKINWRECGHRILNEYFGAIHAGFDANIGVVILRVPEGFDFSLLLEDKKVEPQPEIIFTIHQNSPELPPKTPDSDIQVNFEFPIGKVITETKIVESKNTTPKSKHKRSTLKDASGNELPDHVSSRITRFTSKKQKGTIDVWWLYDDGGLTLLLPYIIKRRSNWQSSRLRVFCSAASQEELEKERAGMAALLDKFRVDYKDLIAITDLHKAPEDSTRAWFDGLVRPFILRNELTESEQLSLQPKIDRNCRLRELLIQHSSNSNLIVMTLPVPRKEAVSAPMYMAWLETLTADLPPFVLVRGNQTPVMTFYA